MAGIGAAVVGTGFIGPVHVEAVRRLGVPVVGVLGSSPDKSRAAAEKLRIPRGYSNFAELLADPAATVVHIASPNRDHFAHARDAILAGKHVICEKPLAMTTAETAELVRLAAETSQITAVNYNVRFYPLILEARARVQAGDVGRIFHVSGSYMQDWLLEPTDFNWRVTAEAGGELRAVADIGTHWLDTLTFITGLEIDAVCADLATVHTTRFIPPAGSNETFARAAAGGTPVPVTTDDCGSILLKFRGGAKGVVTVSQVCAGRKNSLRFDLAGKSQSLSWDAEEPNTLHVGRRGRPNETLIRDPGLLAASAKPYADYPGGHAEGFPDTFKMLYRAVYADIISGAKPPTPLYATFADGHREVQLCEAILHSHRDQRWVTV